MKLPQNEQIKQRIIAMEEPWSDILHGSYHKKLYCLNIISEILFSAQV